MIKENDPTPVIGEKISTDRPVAIRYIQPLLAFIVLVVACFWSVFASHEMWMIAGPPQGVNGVHSHILWVIGRALGEHWYSIYNCMLTAAGLTLLAASRITSKPALAWRVWDTAICCTIMSLGFKLVPLDRPSGGLHGFPSGHTLTAFAASCLLLNTFPKVSPYAFIIAVAVGWSRVEIHEHFVYQVVVGAIMGVLVGVAVSHSKDNIGVILPRALRLFGAKTQELPID